MNFSQHKVCDIFILKVVRVRFEDTYRFNIVFEAFLLEHEVIATVILVVHFLYETVLRYFKV